MIQGFIIPSYLAAGPVQKGRKIGKSARAKLKSSTNLREMTGTLFYRFRRLSMHTHTQKYYSNLLYKTDIDLFFHEPLVTKICLQ